MKRQIRTEVEIQPHELADMLAGAFDDEQAEFFNELAKAFRERMPTDYKLESQIIGLAEKLNDDGKALLKRIVDGFTEVA